MSIKATKLMILIDREKNVANTKKKPPPFSMKFRIWKVVWNHYFNSVALKWKLEQTANMRKCSPHICFKYDKKSNDHTVRTVEVWFFFLLKFHDSDSVWNCNMQPIKKEKNPQQINENRAWAIHKDTQLATAWIEERTEKNAHRKQ